MSRPRSTRNRPLLAGIAAAVLGATALAELPFVNWRRVADPLDTPLVFRLDAKGDGRFLAPRSGRRKHRGVDLAAPLREPVRAIRSGRVAQVGQHRGLGRFVEIRHRWGLRSLYAHLADTAVRDGQRVRQGQVIGAVGKTGNARHAWITPHLHLEVARGRDPVNPESLGLRIAQPPGQPAGAGAAADEEDESAGGGE